MKLAVLLLIAIGTFSSCSEKNENIDMSNIDFNNIKDLYVQPLPVIQKCVEGQWKWIEVTTSGVIGVWHPTNTIVNITKYSCAIKLFYYNKAANSRH